jgi:hypothetical protein
MTRGFEGGASTRDAANDPKVFTSAQQSAFSWLLPLGVLAAIVALRAQREAKPELASARG